MSVAQIQVHPSTRFFTISTAGHVDHGKTSLIRRLTGIDPDRLKEEKERQMTTDLGFAHLQLDHDRVLGFVDVPGHGKFLKNMLAGVGGIDLALLVVAADEGPMPQTRQHVRILSLLGITRAVVAITKIDLADAEQTEIVQQEVQEMLDSHKIELLAICPISSTTGAGFDKLKESLAQACTKVDRGPTAGELNFPVDRVFSKSGFGTVITGTLVSGKLAVGDQVVIEPGALSARVRRLETFGQTVETASAGQRLACNLALKDSAKVERGHVILKQATEGSKTLIVSLYDRPKTLKDQLSDRLSDQPVRLYHGTAEYHGYIRWLEDAAADGEATGFLSLQVAGVIQAQDRFVVRLTDDTIYGGVILFRERPKWLTKAELLVLADLLKQEKFDETVLKLVESSPNLLMREAQLKAILPNESRARRIAELKTAGKLSELGEFLVLPTSREVLTQEVATQMQSELEKLSDTDDGVTLESLRQHLRLKFERPAFQALVDQECLAGRLIRKGDKLFLPGTERKSAAMAPELAGLEAKVKEQLEAHWCLEFEELATLTGAQLKDIKTIVAAMSKNGDVVVAGYDFVASAARVAEAHKILADIWNSKRSIAPTDFRERLNTTRKYAMAMLQYFDDQKITRRLESGRVLLRGPR